MPDVPLSAEVQVYGVRESLRILGELDRKSRLGAIAKIKGSARELVALAQDTYPDQVPLSGMANPGRLQYNPAKVRAGVQVQVGGRARFGEAPLVTLIQKNAGASLYDMAGLASNRRSQARNAGQRAFTANLTKATGKDAQRGMWRSIKKIRDVGYKSILDALEDVARSANRKLVR
jgi:hypothetical protein